MFLRLFSRLQPWYFNPHLCLAFCVFQVLQFLISPAKISARYRTLRAFNKSSTYPLQTSFTAVYACARTYVNDIISRHTLSSSSCSTTISVLPKSRRCLSVCDKFVIVTLMKSYTRLVKNIQHSHKSRAYLSCKTYSLCLTARQGPCRTCNDKIIKTYVIARI